MTRADEENTGVRAGEASRDSSVDVEKLGRQRPEVFKSIWAELGFGFSVFCSMLLAVSLHLHNTHSSTSSNTDIIRNSSSVDFMSFFRPWLKSSKSLLRRKHGHQVSSPSSREPCSSPWAGWETCTEATLFLMAVWYGSSFGLSLQASARTT